MRSITPNACNLLTAKNEFIVCFLDCFIFAKTTPILSKVKKKAFVEK